VNSTIRCRRTCLTLRAFRAHHPIGSPNPTEQGLKDSREEALALANALSRMIAENEARACELVQRAANDLEVAKLEIEELQARAARAEKRAEKAESYLLRLKMHLRNCLNAAAVG
jgi:hypothetical protein